MVFNFILNKTGNKVSLLMVSNASHQRFNLECVVFRPYTGGGVEGVEGSSSGTTC